MFCQCTGAATTVKALLSVLEAVSTKVCHQSKQKPSLTPSGNCNLLSVSDTSGNTDKNFSHRKHHWNTPEIANFVKQLIRRCFPPINRNITTPHNLQQLFLFIFVRYKTTQPQQGVSIKSILGKCSFRFWAHVSSSSPLFQLFQNSLDNYFSIPRRTKHH